MKSRMYFASLVCFHALFFQTVVAERDENRKRRHHLQAPMPAPEGGAVHLSPPAVASEGLSKQAATLVEIVKGETCSSIYLKLKTAPRLGAGSEGAAFKLPANKVFKVSLNVDSAVREATIGHELQTLKQMTHSFVKFDKDSIKCDGADGQAIIARMSERLTPDQKGNLIGDKAPQSCVITIMEYIDGGSLADWDRDFAKSKSRKVAAWQMIASLYQAWSERQFMQQDLKPTNIFVKNTVANNWKDKVCFFWSAKCACFKNNDLKKNQYVIADYGFATINCKSSSTCLAPSSSAAAGADLQEIADFWVDDFFSTEKNENKDFKDLLHATFVPSKVPPLQTITDVNTYKTALETLMDNMATKFFGAERSGDGLCEILPNKGNQPRCKAFPGLCTTVELG